MTNWNGPKPKDVSAGKSSHQLMMVVHGDFVELLAIAGQLAAICADGQIKKAEIRDLKD